MSYLYTALYFRFHTCCETMVLQKTRKYCERNNVSWSENMCFANMPSTNHHYLTFTRILDPAGFHPGALCGANRPVLEWAISHVVWDGVPIICDRVRFSYRYVFKPKNRSKGDLTSKNNMQDGHDGQSILKFTIFQNHFIPKHWPLDLFGGHWKMQKHSEKKHFLNLEMAMWYVYVACQHGWRQLIFKKTWIMCRCACGFATCVFTNQWL